MSLSRSGLLALSLLLATLGASAQPTGWRVHEGTAARYSFGRTVDNGDNEAFLSGAQVPASTDPGWSALSSDGTLRWSGPGGTPCRTQANYTYFETYVTPTFDQGYALDFISVDDAASVSTTVGTGTINIPEYVGLREAKLMPLHFFLTPGVSNRVVVTLADVCGAGNGIRAELRATHGAESDDAMEPEVSAPAAAPSFPSGPFRLQTQFLQDDACLEANGPASPVHSGASFMDSCQDVSGQVWMAVPIQDGYFRLQSPLHGAERCLESNSADQSYFNGAAYMDTCQNVTGQMWRAVPAGDGYYRLQTEYRGTGECLESNNAESPAHGGAAFMDQCQNVGGQLWRFVSL